MFVIPVTSPSAHRVSAARLFDHLVGDRATASPTGPRVPALDVAEDDRHYTLSFEVPGASREQLEVSVHGRRVVLGTRDAVTGTETEGAAALKKRTLYRERASAVFARTVVLPSDVDAASASARMDAGVLTLTLAKTQPAGATQITIG